MREGPKSALEAAERPMLSLPVGSKNPILKL